MPIDLTKLRSYQNDECGYIGWSPGWDYMHGEGNYNSNISFNTWKEFYDAWGDNDPELNTVVNYYFGESVRDENEEVLEVSLYLWVVHSRKGASRGITVNFIKENELHEVKEYLKTQFQQIHKWFEWVEHN